MYQINKLAIFDLDDTLIEGNSHIEILNQNSRVMFNSFIFKVIGKISPITYKKIIDYKFNKLDEEQINSFFPKFKDSALEILKTKKREGYEIFVISNAPQKLIDHICSLQNLKGFQSEIGKKHEILYNNFKYKELFVCTDNKTDIELLKLASQRCVYINHKTKDFFKKKVPNSIFLEV